MLKIFLQKIQRLIVVKLVKTRTVWFRNCIDHYIFSLESLLVFKPIRSLKFIRLLLEPEAAESVSALGGTVGGACVSLGGRLNTLLCVVDWLVNDRLDTDNGSAAFWAKLDVFLPWSLLCLTDSLLCLFDVLL